MASMKDWRNGCRRLALIGTSGVASVLAVIAARQLASRRSLVDTRRGMALLEGEPTPAENEAGPAATSPPECDAPSPINGEGVPGAGNPEPSVATRAEAAEGRRRGWTQRMDESRASGCVVIPLAVGLLILGLRTGGVLGDLTKTLATIGFGLSLVEGVMRLGHKRDDQKAVEILGRVTMILTLCTWFVAHILPHGAQWIMTGSYVLQVNCASACHAGSSSTILIQIHDDGTDGQFSGTAQRGSTPSRFGTDYWELSGNELGNNVMFSFSSTTPDGFVTFNGLIGPRGSLTGMATSEALGWVANVVTLSGHATAYPGWTFWVD